MAFDRSDTMNDGDANYTSPLPGCHHHHRHRHSRSIHIHAIVIYIYIQPWSVSLCVHRAARDGIIIINSNLTYNDNSFQHLFFACLLYFLRVPVPCWVMEIAIAFWSSWSSTKQGLTLLLVFLCCFVPVVDNIVAEIIKQNSLRVEPRYTQAALFSSALLSQSYGVVSNAWWS